MESDAFDAESLYEWCAGKRWETILRDSVHTYVHGRHRTIDVEIPTKEKDEVAETLKHLVEGIADLEGLRIGRIRFDREDLDRFIDLASNLGI